MKRSAASACTGWAAPRHRQETETPWRTAGRPFLVVAEWKTKWSLDPAAVPATYFFFRVAFFLAFLAFFLAPFFLAFLAFFLVAFFAAFFLVAFFLATSRPPN